MGPGWSDHSINPITHCNRLLTTLASGTDSQPSPVLARAKDSEEDGCLVRLLKRQTHMCLLEASVGQQKGRGCLGVPKALSAGQGNPWEMESWGVTDALQFPGSGCGHLLPEPSFL